MRLDTASCISARTPKLLRNSAELSVQWEFLQGAEREVPPLGAIRSTSSAPAHQEPETTFSTETTVPTRRASPRARAADQNTVPDRDQPHQRAVTSHSHLRTWVYRLQPYRRKRGGPAVARVGRVAHLRVRDDPQLPEEREREWERERERRGAQWSGHTRTARRRASGSQSIPGPGIVN